MLEITISVGLVRIRPRGRTFYPQLSVISGSIACILATLAIAASVPGLLRVKVK